MMRRAGGIVAIAAMLGAAGLPSPVRAEQDRPVYVQYEGFVKPGNGVIVLSFGYFNMNDEAITIPRGRLNAFTPAPDDRRQPATFVKGRLRSACVLVFGSDFDGNLRWRVENGGTVSETTARVLDPNYALEDESAAQAIAGLNLETAPRGTCLEPDRAASKR